MSGKIQIFRNFGKELRIINKTALSSIEFRENRKQIGLDIAGVKETTLTALQECLQYTCLVKLAPEWNILQDILIEGPGFLETLRPLNSIKIDIFVSSNEITLCLEPSCVKLPPIRMEQFSTPEQLSTASIIQVQEKCHVLPSMKTATIHSISRSPGISGVFKTYKEIQKHWEDMYGYILPNVPENRIWYFNVVFNIPNSISYTYPHFCVKPYGLTVVPRVDPRPILCTFIKTFCKKMGNICGEKCRIIEGKASFPEIKLYPAIEVSEEMKPRPGTTYAMNPNAPYRKDIPKSNYYSSYNTIQTCQSNRNTSCISNNAGDQSASVTSALSLHSQPGMEERKPSNLNNESNTKLATFYEKGFKDTTASDKERVNVCNNNLTSSKKLPLPYQTAATETSQKKYAPCFYPKKPKNIAKPLTSAQDVVQPTLYAPKFVAKNRVSNSAKYIVKNCIPKADEGKITVQDLKIENTEQCSEDLVKNKNIWSNFNVKKKIPKENDSAKVKKGASKNKRKLPVESSVKAKKFKSRV